MRERKIVITNTDRDRLERLFLGTSQWSSRDREHLQALEKELDTAHTVASREIPGDVVTMHSQVRVKDMKAGTEMDLRVVFPSEADSEQSTISILAPIGTALLGYRVGDTVEWKVPAELRRLKIERILYQPEAVGDYHLWVAVVRHVFQRRADDWMLGVLPVERKSLRKANSMWHVPSLVWAYVWSLYIRCPRCGTPQRVTKNSVRPGMRILCWQCKRIFSP